MKKTIILIVLAFITAMGGWAQEAPTKSWRTLKGYKAFYEVEYGFDVDDKEDYYTGDRPGGYPQCNNLMLSTSQGYQINNIVYVGGGIGLLRYLDGKQTLMPMFADVRVNFLNDKKVLPFCNARIGGVFGTWGGVYASVWLGARLKTSQKHAVSFSVGMSEHIDQWQAISYIFAWQAYSLGLKLGYEF